MAGLLGSIPDICIENPLLSSFIAIVSTVVLKRIYPVVPYVANSCTRKKATARATVATSEATASPTHSRAPFYETPMGDDYLERFKARLNKAQVIAPPTKEPKPELIDKFRDLAHRKMRKEAKKQKVVRQQLRGQIRKNKTKINNRWKTIINKAIQVI